MALVERQDKKGIEQLTRCDRLLLVHECPPCECTAQLSPLIFVVGGFFVVGIKKGPKKGPS